jgi:hypothetical protein
VAAELERQASWSPEVLRFWHFREAEREVDVIVERPSGEILGIEVKASATVRTGDFAGWCTCASARADDSSLARFYMRASERSRLASAYGRCH